MFFSKCPMFPPCYLANLIGSKDSFILLFNAKIALLALILRSTDVPLKEQFFAPIVNPKYLNDFTFSMTSFWILMFKLQSLLPRLITIPLVFPVLTFRPQNTQNSVYLNDPVILFATEQLSKPFKVMSDLVLRLIT